MECVFWKTTATFYRSWNSWIKSGSVGDGEFSKNNRNFLEILKQLSKSYFTASRFFWKDFRPWCLAISMLKTALMISFKSSTFPTRKVSHKNIWLSQKNLLLPSRGSPPWAYLYKFYSSAAPFINYWKENLWNKFLSSTCSYSIFEFILRSP